jgi:WD40 repeat protein
MGERIVSGSEDAEIAVWEGGESNKLIWKQQGQDGAKLSMAIAGEKIFSSSEDKTIRVWDLDTGDIKSIIHDHTAPINAIKLSLDGRWIVSASDDARIRVLDPHTGQQHMLPELMPCRIISVAISRDGKLVACCGVDGQVHIWYPDMEAPAAWPDSFIRRVHGLEHCPVDDQGIHVNTTLQDDGWLYGSTGEVMCWIPPAHRLGLMTQWTKDIFGVPVTALDARKFVHGTRWEQCTEDYKQLEALKEMLQITLD